MLLYRLDSVSRGRKNASATVTRQSVTTDTHVWDSAASFSQPMFGSPSGKLHIVNM